MTAVGRGAPTLTEFLLARIAEDEAKARAARDLSGGHWWTKDVDPWGLAIEGSTAGVGNPRAMTGDPELWDHEGALGMHPETATHVVAWAPDRVLAECEAKRRIVEEWREGATRLDDQGRPAHLFDPVASMLLKSHERWLRFLAQPYADHPDFNPEWRP